MPNPPAGWKPGCLSPQPRGSQVLQSFSPPDQPGGGGGKASQWGSKRPAAFVAPGKFPSKILLWPGLAALAWACRPGLAAPATAAEASGFPAGRTGEGSRDSRFGLSAGRELGTALQNASYDKPGSILRSRPASAGTRTDGRTDSQVCPGAQNPDSRGAKTQARLPKPGLNCVGLRFAGPGTESRGDRKAPPTQEVTPSPGKPRAVTKPRPKRLQRPGAEGLLEEGSSTPFILQTRSFCKHTGAS